MSEYFEGNIYYSPEKCGMELIDVVDNTKHECTFDYTIYLRHIETGKYYTASDSGCSCPTPFEDFRCIADLDEIDEHRAYHH